MVAKKFTECKVGRNKGTGKPQLQYKNERTGRTLPMTVGKRGGLSLKSPGSKHRRYMGSVCKKTRCSKTFWSEKTRMHKAKKFAKQGTKRRR